MAVDKTNYDVPFRAPAIPNFPEEYDRASLDQFGNVLRLYFTQVDTILRRANSTDTSDAAAWFLGS
jgi:hypothetical protein